jgi:hypothetical protein
MTQNDDPLSKLAARFKEAIRQSLPKPWVKERYAPPEETTSELRELLERLDQQNKP